MTDSDVANSLRARIHLPPSGSVLNALNIALQEAVLSSASATAAAVNGTSAALDSAVASSASAVHSASTTVSHVASASASSGLSSSILANPSLAASALTSDEGNSTLVATSRVTSAPVQETSAALASPSNSSASELAQSIPKNAAAVSSSSSVTSVSSTAPAAPSPASPISSSSATAEESATLETNAASDSSSTSTSPATTSTPVLSAAPEPSSSTAPKTSTEEVQAPSPATSEVTDTVSTQRGAQSPSTTTSSSSLPTVNNQAPSPTTSGDENSNPTTEASSSQRSGTTNASTNGGSSGSSFLSATQKNNITPSATGETTSVGASNIGNSFIGVTSSSSVHADSTLAAPEAETVTSGGSTFATTPAVITSIFTSSGSNGSPPQTFTSVFANPTVVPQASLSNKSFWDNKGAVAGVFISVVIVIIPAILGIVYCCRSKRRRRIQRDSTEDIQYRRFSGLPDIAQLPTTYQPVRGRDFAFDGSHRALMAPSITSGRSNRHEDPTTIQRSLSQVSHNSSGDMQHTGALGLTGIVARPSGLTQDYTGPFSDYYRYISTGDTRLATPPGESPAGIAITSDFEKPIETGREAESKAERRPPSPAHSSPSIYPPSLPVVLEKDEDDYLFYEQETKRRPESRMPSPPPKGVVDNSDSQNPFSSPLDPIYDGNVKQIAPTPSHINRIAASPYRPLTPPDSSAGHSPTTAQLSETGTEESMKPLNVTPFAGAFLGRSVSLRTEHLPRPPRSPLRLSAYASRSSLQNTDIH